MTLVNLQLKRLIRGFSAVIALTTAVGSLQSVSAQTTTYVVTDVSVDGGATQVSVKLNNLGDLVGRAGDAVDGHAQATLWSRSKLVKKHLGVFTGGDYSSAMGINDMGEVTGVSNTGTRIIPFLWTAAGGLKRVPLLPGDSCGQASSINRYGHIVGYSSGQTGTKAFFWGRSGSVRELATLAGGNDSKARDLNDRDEIVGTSASYAGERAVLWTATGSIRDLGTLPEDSQSEATAINNAGEVVGYSIGPRGMRAFIWTKAAGMQEIGVTPDIISSRALAINDSGDVVGSFTSASGDHAFRWNKASGIADLNTAKSLEMGILFIEAHAINSAGQILVLGETAHQMRSGANPSEHDRCAPAPPSNFLLTPAPGL